LKELEHICREYGTVLPIVSQACQTTDTRFGRAEDFLARVEELTGHKPIDSIQAAEPIGPKQLLDVLVIAPCTGNTLAKLAAGVTDTPVTMAAKAHLRNDRPLVAAIATNDGLSAAARNLGELLARKNYYFVPFGQDDPQRKPCSLMADFTRIGETVEAALEGRQIQPVLLR
jgi:dipicolinate synthase subunit B